MSAKTPQPERRGPDKPTPVVKMSWLLSPRPKDGLTIDAETGKYRPRKRLRYRPGRESAPPRRKRY